MKSACTLLFLTLSIANASEPFCVRAHYYNQEFNEQDEDFLASLHLEGPEFSQHFPQNQTVDQDDDQLLMYQPKDAQNKTTHEDFPRCFPKCCSRNGQFGKHFPVTTQAQEVLCTLEHQCALCDFNCCNQQTFEKTKNYYYPCTAVLVGSVASIFHSAVTLGACVVDLVHHSCKS